MATGTSHQSSADTAWRGRQADADGAEIRHQWQRGADQQVRRAWWRGRGLRLSLWGLIFFVLLGAFVWKLLLARPRVPLIAIAATEYDWPLPPNAWALEDVRQLGQLDELRLFDSSPAWRSSDRGMEELTRLLQQVVDQTGRRQPLIVLVSMHSAVAVESGEPTACLLPPGCDPLDESTWLPLRDLVLKIDEQARQRDVLLVLDCQRRAFNPQIGKLANSFAQRVPEALRKSGAQRVSVLTAAAGSQQSWTSEALRGSVFGHVFRQGLAGGADGAAKGGRDGRVTIGELHQYVAQRVSRWAELNRAAAQEPQLSLAPRHDLNSHLAWAMRTQPASIVVPDAADPPVAIDALWRRNEELRTGGRVTTPFARFPAGWQRLQHDLVMLEELLSAGPGYAKRAGDLAERIEQTLSEVEEQVRSAGSVESQWQALAHASMPVGAELTAASLPMSELLGALTDAQRQELNAAVNQFVTQPTHANLEEAIERFSAIVAAGAGADGLAEVHRLRLLHKYAIPAAWAPSPEVARAVALSRRAERAAAPLDYRCWRWGRELVERGDARRRPVEDSLLAPGATAQGAIVELLSQAEIAYAQAEHEIRRAAEVLEARDLVWDSLLPLAQWHLRFGAHRAADDDRDLSDRLADLILSAAEADRVIAEGGPLDPLFDEAGQSKLARQWAALAAMFDSDVQRLADMDQPSPADMRDIQVLLRSPLLAASKRSRLRTVLAKFQETPPGDSLPPSGDSPHATYPQWLERQWGESHLLLAMLDGDLTAPPEAAGEQLGNDADPLARDQDWDQQGAVLRSRLRLLRGGTPGQRPADNTAMRQRAQAARRGAAFGAAPSREDPVATLWRSDLRELFLWQASRTEGDLLGPLDSSQPSFFLLTATAYRRNAGLLEPLPQDEDARQAAALQRLADQVQDALGVKANARLLLAEDEAFEVDCQVVPGSTPWDASADGPPLGLAAVQIRDRHARPVAADGLGDITETTEAVVSVETSVVQEHGPHLTAVAVLRGHEYAAPFEVEGLDGLRVEFQPPVYDRTAVTVRPSAREGKSIVFILDCSASMIEALPGEGQSEQSRLELAKSRLQGVLDQVVQQGRPMRVGVRFFGHRLGWTETAPLEARVQEAYLAALLKDVGPAQQQALEASIRNLPPSQDVEAVLRPGVFGVEELRKVRLRMKSLQPWGQSPLYLALTQATADLKAEPPELEKSIVVITDGLNYQWTPQERRSAAPSNTTLDQVIQAHGDLQIPIYIVGFGVREDERQEARDAYTQLTEATGGEFVSVDRADELLETLQGVLSQRAYAVRDDTGKLVGVGPNQSAGLFKLGVPLSVVPSPKASRPFLVEIPPDLAEEIQLEGGESVMLQVTADGRQLQSVPFDDQVVADGATIDGLGSPTGHLVRVHQPRASSRSVELRVSLQHPQLLVTSRPKDVWVEVEPLDDLGQPLGERYLLYDPQFAAERPVPVLEATLSGWPLGATRAQMECWFRERKAPPAAVQSLAAVVEAPAAFARFQPVPGLDTVRIQVQVDPTDTPDRPFRVRVVSQYDQDASPIRVSLDPADLRLLRVVRQFDAEHSMDSHSFYIEADSINQLKGCQIELTPRAAVQADSIYLGRPLVFPVYQSGDTLPVNGASLPLNPAQGP